MKPTISPVGDCAISIDFGQVIDPKINRQIRQIIEQIKDLQLDGIIELVPTYCALLVQYDAMVYSYSDICRILEPTLQESVMDSANELVTIVEIPTVYGGEFGPDLGFVASHNHLSEAEVVSIHSGTDYLVYMLGFIPGFTYLGGRDPRMATPRLSSPRTLIPAGSVCMTCLRNKLHYCKPETTFVMCLSMKTNSIGLNPWVWNIFHLYMK